MVRGCTAGANGLGGGCGARASEPDKGGDCTLAVRSSEGKGGIGGGAGASFDLEGRTGCGVRSCREMTGGSRAKTSCNMERNSEIFDR